MAHNEIACHGGEPGKRCLGNAGASPVLYRSEPDFLRDVFSERAVSAATARSVTVQRDDGIVVDCFELLCGDAFAHRVG